MKRGKGPKKTVKNKKSVVRGSGKSSSPMPVPLQFKAVGVEDVYPEVKCALPRYLPGDIILTKKGEVGVIMEATVVVNGGIINWAEELPSVIEHGRVPSYSLGFIPGFKAPLKVAWWTSDEWFKVSKGVLHRILGC